MKTAIGIYASSILLCQRGFGIRASRCRRFRLDSNILSNDLRNQFELPWRRLGMCPTHMSGFGQARQSAFRGEYRLQTRSYLPRLTVGTSSSDISTAVPEALVDLPREVIVSSLRLCGGAASKLLDG